MKVSRGIVYRTVLSVLFAISIVLALRHFMSENQRRIANQNEEYITELTKQGVKSLDNLLKENLGFIESTAYLYGESLSSPWADVAVIRANEENSVFENLCFIDESGDVYTGRGVVASLYDREYFQSGMHGASGVYFVPQSRISGEKALGFYAPVLYEGEVIGVMAGFYGEDFISESLEYSLFDYDGESWLCASDGTVIGTTMYGDRQNYLTYLEDGGRCSDGELARVREALSEQVPVTFTYQEEGQQTIVYGQNLEGMSWMMFRDFPPSATKMLLDTANRSGTQLLTILMISFFIFGTLFAIGMVAELVENRKMIEKTKRDPLTNLYNRQYFYHYVEQFDQHHRNRNMDAVLIDADHFQIINERYGRRYGDEVLKRIADSLLAVILETDGVLCRREADVFMMYCPHREDYSMILEKASVRIMEEGEDAARIRIRMGIYPDVDKGIEPVRRFDMAKSAADTIRGNYHTQIAYYDDRILRKELYDDRLISDFDDAIANEQFRIYLQPKFDVRGKEPVPSGAEALVRWEHPKLGLLGPDRFIPLFEKSGLIERLDVYVWTHTARQMQTWKERYGRTLPVSVNVSRVDLYDPELPGIFTNILDEYGLMTKELLLEITESAYMEDSAAIIESARKLRDEGFKIEMDDFGTGYSSLNMINDLPIDVLKLDMAFVRSAFREGRDTRMLGIIIDIARYLSVPVIAEGVETFEQMETLRQLGCDYIQGYYFSKPIPAEEFEKYISANM